MKNKQKKIKIFFLLFVFFISSFHNDLKAQSITTYYGFSSDVQYPYGLKTDTSGNFYFINYDINWNPKISKLSPDGTISTFVSGSYYPQSLGLDGFGNLFFSDGNTWPPDIKKVTPDGTVSSFVSGNFYAQDITFNTQGDMYFSDGYNWPGSIKKVTADGTVSSFLADPNSYPQYLAFDKSDTLYFTDNYNWPPEIKKITPDGTVSNFVPNNYSPQNLTFDTSGNMYFIDTYNWPYNIKQVTPDGTVSTFVSSGLNNPSSLTIDKSGNLYFLDQTNGQFFIKTIRNPASVCTLPPPPTVNDTAVCYGSAITLFANGIGELQWYDASTGGSLLSIGSNFTTTPLTANTTFYVEGYFCNSSTTRTALNVSINPPPAAIISGSTTGNDYVTLTALGGSSYLWSGGYSPISATNVFTKSGTYSVTVTSSGGCSDVASVAVTVNKFGLNKNGQLINDTLTRLSKNGAFGTTTFVNKHGQSNLSKIGDGILNYTVFTAAGTCAVDEIDFIGLTNPANQTSSGTYSSATLLDWSSWSVLNSVGISIPNGGDNFALATTGYFLPEETGTYTFTCEGDDAVDLFINGVNVANNYSCHGIAGLGSHTGTINLVAGTRYTFRARMQENGGGEGLRVFWRRPSESSGWNIYDSEISSQ